MKFSKLPTRQKHAWIYFAILVMVGFALIPTPLTLQGWQGLIAGVCLGAATMIAMFMLGKKAANEVE